MKSGAATAATTLMMVVLAMTTTTTLAFPNGASNNGSNPLDTLSSHCTSGNFRPNHGNNLPQATPPPFKITLTSPAGSIYRPHQKVTVTIESKMSAIGKPLAYLKGFFLQGDSTESAFSGDLECDPGHGKKVNFCTKVGMTHTNAMPKAKVVCRWSPPDFQIGKVQFVATIVENFTTFWTGVKSDNYLTADPKTMSYGQKAKQLTSLMMNRLQGTTQNFMNMMSKQQGENSLMNLFGGAAGAGNNNNAFASLMSQVQAQNKMTDNNPFASLMSQFQGQGQSKGAETNPWGSFRGLAGGNPGESHVWSMAGAGQPSPSRVYNRFDRNQELARSNLPQTFQSFFQP